MLPLVVARRQGEEMLARLQAALSERTASERAWLQEQTQGGELSPQAMRISVYDLGVAVMNGEFYFRAPAGTGLHEAAQQIRALTLQTARGPEHVISPLALAFKELAHESLGEFHAAARRSIPHRLQAPWRSPGLGVRTGAGARTPAEDWGRLLWIHPIVRTETRGHNEQEAVARALAPAFHDTIGLVDGVFVPGIGWSAIVGPYQGTGMEVALRLTELQWAYIALYMEVDRALLDLLDDERWRAPGSLRELEADADEVFDDYLRVMRARSRLDSVLASLGGDELSVWQTIAEVQKLDALVKGVDRKADVLQRLAERRVQQASANRAQRTSRILSFLTALTLITVAVALLDNFLGTKSDALGHLAVRTAIVGAALLTALAVYREAFRDRGHSDRHIDNGTR